VPVEVTVTVTGSGEAWDLAALRDWLRAEPELRGRVRLAGKPPDPGSMGALSDLLTVAVGPGAAVTVFASALVTWIRHRTRTAHVRVSWPDGAEIELSTDRLGSMDAAAVQAQVAGLVRALESRGGQQAGGGGSPGDGTAGSGSPG
jgi:hypothetical protein